MRTSRWMSIAALALTAVLLGLAGDSSCVMAQGTCRSTCLSQYNQCRIAKKGAPSCDQQYQLCLQRCVTRR